MKHAIAVYKATTAYTNASTDAGAALASLLSGGTRVWHWQSAQRLWPDTKRLQLPSDDCCRLCVCVHSIQQTEQILIDPSRMGAKNTTTSNHPSNPTTSKMMYRHEHALYYGMIPFIWYECYVTLTFNAHN